MPFPKKVRIIEVSPRDGLQNEKIIIPTATKIDFINRLSETGLSVIEVTSFVSPKRIPQLADALEVFKGIQKKNGIHYPVLVPNTKGLENALSVDVKEISVLCAGSESFSQANIHCSIDESLQRIKEILEITKKQSIKVRGYISCVLGCPYEGEVSQQKIVELTKKLLEMGCDEISLGDTIGVGTPKKAAFLIQEIIKQNISIEKIAVHFHDTYGQALANIYACLELGVATIDSSVAGLGGCPYAFGASGNVATEDVLYMLNGMGIETGVDLEKCIELNKMVIEFTGRPPRSKVSLAKLGC